MILESEPGPSVAAPWSVSTAERATNVAASPAGPGERFAIASVDSQPPVAASISNGSEANCGSVNIISTNPGSA